MESTIKDLNLFLQIGARLPIKTVALEQILGLTGSPEGIETITNNPELLLSLITLLKDPTVSIAKDASLCLVNISATGQEDAEKLLNVDTTKYCPPPLQKHPQNIVHQCLEEIFNSKSQIADQCCMILSNLTREPYLLHKVIDLFETSGKSLDDLVEVFTKKKYNENAWLYYLGPFLSNLTQSSKIRLQILDKEKDIIQKLLAFTEYPDSLVKRGGIIGTIKNCCFETDYHDWLLSEEVDILPKILLPLAGPEEFDEEDTEKLPLELQYLSEIKQRESDPDIRFMLLEALLQLCSKKISREFIRNRNTYVILRELHKWETDKKCQQLCTELVVLLKLKTEDEIGKDNLKELDIPDDLIEKIQLNEDVYVYNNEIMNK